MATEIGKAYVQIVPSARGIKGAIESELNGEAGNAGKSAGESLGSNLVGTLKKVVVAAGIGKLIKDSIDEGGRLQQSYGGLDTIYGEASAAAKDYAEQAYKAGISANDYAEQAVSFGASLRAAFSGDTTKAVEAANTAIMDMTDNAAKMGTPIQNIQNAYQGFAKQNYTMLDNLKLGYGGTKTEMQRLLKDAEKLSGVKYDIGNLGDVYEAIHVIQGELGMTGVAAYEAEGTFTGSMGAMNAALKNFLGALSTGGDVGPALEAVIGNAGVFLQNNLIPMIMNIVNSLPQVIQAAAPALVEAATSLITSVISNLSTLIPALLEAGKMLFGALIDSIGELAPMLFETAKELIHNLVGSLNGDVISAGSDIDLAFLSGILDDLPEFLEAGAEILMSIVEGIGEKLPDVIQLAGDIINKFASRILESLPAVINTATQIVQKLAQGITSKLPDIVRTAGEVIKQFLETVLKSLPEIIKSGIELLMSIVKGVSSGKSTLFTEIGQILIDIVKIIIEHLPELIQMGIELIGALIAGIATATVDLLQSIGTLIMDVINKFKEIDWGELGRNIIQGIVNGLKNAGHLIVEAVGDAAKSALNAAKNFLGIRSPSKVFRDEVGAMMAEGIAVGFEENMPTAEIEHSLSGMTASAAASAATYSYGGFTINVYGAPGQDITELADEIEYRINSKIQSMGAVYA